MENYIQFKLKPVQYKVTHTHGGATRGEVRTAYVVCKNELHEYKMGATVALLFHPAASNDYCPSLALAVLREDDLYYRAYDEYTYLNLDDENASVDDWFFHIPQNKDSNKAMSTETNIENYIDKLLKGKGLYIKEEFKEVLEDLHNGESIVSSDMHGIALQFLFSEGLVESNENSELRLTQTGEEFATELFGPSPLSQELKHNQYCAEQIIAHIQEALKFISETRGAKDVHIEEINWFLQEAFNESHLYVRNIQNKGGA